LDWVRSLVSPVHDVHQDSRAPVLPTEQNECLRMVSQEQILSVSVLTSPPPSKKEVFFPFRRARVVCRLLTT
ncbi:hypothetical protein CLOP_g13186, partial [Closterium sp. NIES-67]